MAASAMQRRILIIDDHNDLAEALDEVFTHSGHKVRVVEDRASALAIDDMQNYDLVITDLDVENVSSWTNLNGNSSFCFPKNIESQADEHVKAFKICASNFRRDDF